MPHQGTPTDLPMPSSGFLQVALLLSIALALALVAAAPIVVLLGGEAYRAAGTVLAIQAYALVGAFVTQVAIFRLFPSGVSAP